MKAVVSSKGQVTIPKRLREQPGIRPGQVLEFGEEAGRLVAQKTVMADPVDTAYGILALDRPTNALMEELCGPAGPP